MMMMDVNDYDYQDWNDYQSANEDEEGLRMKMVEDNYNDEEDKNDCQK